MPAPTPACRLRSGLASSRELVAAYRWLDEAFAHLDAIGPVVAHRFALEPGIDLAPLAWRRGYVAFAGGRVAGQEVVDRVEAGYRLGGEASVTMVAPPALARTTAEPLRLLQVAFDYRPSPSGGVRGAVGIFEVAREVAASVRLVPDYGRGVVAVALANVDRLETVTLEFAAGSLGEPALEDLLRLVLGESDAFLRRAPFAGFGPR
jgi:hypothetical protein